MALTGFQLTVLGLIAANRSPNSLFAGGAVANRDGPRLSEDLDIEHASAEAVRLSSDLDFDTLRNAGFIVRETEKSRPRFGFVEAIAERGDRAALLDWTNDTAVRFFPAVRDDVFGWRLHDADVALNKLLALAGRRAARDYYDVVRLHQKGFPLSTLAWAAMGKDSGMSPDLVLDEASRNSRYSDAEIARDILAESPIDPVALKRVFLEALAEARDAVAAMTRECPEGVGRLAIAPDGTLARLDANALRRRSFSFHASSIGGAWPQISEVPPD